MPNDPNDEASLKEAKEYIKQQSAVKKLNDSNRTRKYIARDGNLGPTSVNEMSENQQAFVARLQNRESAQKNSIWYGYTIGSTRDLNAVEKDIYNALFSLPTEGSRGYKQVKFYADGTPSDAFPNLASYSGPKSQQEALKDLIPEVLVSPDFLSNGDIPSGTRIIFEYLDKKNNLFPILKEIPKSSSEPVIDPEKNYTFTSEMLKTTFDTGTIPESMYFENTSGKKTEDLKKIKYFVIHDTAGAKFRGIETLVNKGAGIHYFVAENGKIIKAAEWNQPLTHGGARTYNRYGLGVEVINPVDPRKGGITSHHKHSMIANPIWSFPFSPVVKYVHIPTERQMESVWSLVQIVTSSKELGIPLKFPGYLGEDYSDYKSSRKNMFVMTGRQHWSKIDTHKPGIVAHSYVPTHSDGAITTLYCFLRSRGLSPTLARESLGKLLKPENLIIIPGPRKSDGKMVDEYYANLNLIYQTRKSFEKEGESPSV